MRVIPPLEITAARLTTPAVAEPDTAAGEQVYNPATTYGEGQTAILGSPTSTVTISNAAPAVVSWASHGQPEGTPVVLTTTGTLPAGLTAGATYYVRNPAAGTFQLAASAGGLVLATSSAGSGTHTATTQIHRVYRSKQAGNTGNYPLLAASAAWWEDIGPTNRYAMFDVLRNTATRSASPMTVVITPGQRVDSIALLGVVAQSVQVTVTSVSAGGTVYDRTVSLQARDTGSWRDYFFGVFRYRTAVALYDLPLYTDAVITVTLTHASANIQCGALVIGMSEFLGSTRLAAVADVLNFSTVTRDIDGNATMTRRRNAPVTKQVLMSDKGLVPKLCRVRDDLDATPAVWSSLDDVTDSDYFEAFLILGFYRKFLINAEYPTEARVELELEEV